jgi:hypothetical protein
LNPEMLDNNTISRFPGLAKRRTPHDKTVPGGLALLVALCYNDSARGGVKDGSICL